MPGIRYRPNSQKITIGRTLIPTNTAKHRCLKWLPCLKLPALLSSLARFTIGDSGAVASLDSSGESGGTGGNCIKIGLPGKLILSKRKGLWEVLFSY